jgi:hypothetical protein
VSLYQRLTAPVALALVVVAACGGGATQPTIQATPSAAPTSGATSPPTSSGSGSADTAKICRDLNTLKSLDYAFGAPFSSVQSLADASKAQTFTDVSGFVSEAPPELQTAANDLLGLWSDLVNNPQSVTESDPRWAEATNSINTWVAANCG